MRILILFALGISIPLSAFVLIPAPSRWLLPLGVAVPELSPWLVVFNLCATAVALTFYRQTVPFFLVSLLVSAWPLAQIAGVVRSMDLPSAEHGRSPFSLLDSFRGVPSGQITGEPLPLNILFYRPRAAGPSPVLIDIYGGAWQRGAPADNRRFDSYMASRGYAVFAIDYRHAPAARFPAQLEDVRAAITFIHANAARYNLDMNRLALCGRSAGGQLALLAAYEPGSVPIHAVISFYGPPDLTEGYTDLPSPDPLDVRSVLETYLGGSPAQLPDRYHEASPVSYASRPLPPTLLIQGQRDHIVKPVFARELYAKLLASGNRAYLLEIPWAEHAFDAIFSGPGNQLALFYVERFLKSSLNPETAGNTQ